LLLSKTKEKASNAIRKKFFIRVVRHWNRLSREIVDAPSLEVFKVSLDVGFSNLI